MDLDTTFDELIEHFGVVPNDVYLPFDLAALAGRTDPPRRTP